MEPSEMKKYLVPGVAVAVIIAVIGVFIAIGADKPGPGSGSAKKENSSGGLTVKAGADTSDAGMTFVMPPAIGPEWSMLPGGLKIWDVKVGEGETVSAGQTVAVHYIGWLKDGFVFDSSKKQGKHIEFSLNGVIQGWKDGIPGMKIGGVRRLFVPAALAYKGQGQGSVPPDADLIFEVKLLGYQ